MAHHFFNGNMVSKSQTKNNYHNTSQINNPQGQWRLPPVQTNSSNQAQFYYPVNQTESEYEGTSYESLTFHYPINEDHLTILDNINKWCESKSETIKSSFDVKDSKGNSIMNDYDIYVGNMFIELTRRFTSSNMNPEKFYKIFYDYKNKIKIGLINIIKRIVNVINSYIGISYRLNDPRVKAYITIYDYIKNAIMTDAIGNIEFKNDYFKKTRNPIPITIDSYIFYGRFEEELTQNKLLIKQDLINDVLIKQKAIHEDLKKTGGKSRKRSKKNNKSKKHRDAK